jgi:cobalamin biosynthesis Mg chelatase CobN
LLAVQLIEEQRGLARRRRRCWRESRLSIRLALRDCGRREIDAVLQGLDGGFVAPGPSGAPTRGRLDVLPTGRNFYSLDNRTVPTPIGWRLGRQSADDLLARHFQDFGSHPKAIGLSAWGTSNMRTGGEMDHISGWVDEATGSFDQLLLAERLR